MYRTLKVHKKWKISLVTVLANALRMFMSILCKNKRKMSKQYIALKRVSELANKACERVLGFIYRNTARE